MVIGIDGYPNLPARSQLSGCVNDADAIREFLLDRLKVPAGAVQFLTSPRDLTAPETFPAATAANIRSAFASLTAPGALAPGDHVVLYYAGHGARLTRAAADGSKEGYYGLVARDVTPGAGGGWSNMILGSEIYAFLRAVEAQGATATVIADTCHSGASTRDLDEGVAVRDRALPIAPLSDAQWRDLLQAHPALSTAAARGADERTTPLGAYPGGDFVMLTGCLDAETSKEADGHGLLTGSLLAELRAIPAERVAALRWIDFSDRLRTTVARRAMTLAGSSPQTPVLEGRPEKPVFGGAWHPFDPGFTVRRRDDGTLTLDGGEAHGLEAGATVAIYPPGTADFANPPGAGIPAVVASATAMSSVVRPQDPSAIVADGSRARVTRPGPHATPIAVRIVDGDRPMPDAMREAMRREAAASAAFTLVDAATPAHAELRRWSGEVPKDVWPNAPAWAGARDGWILLRKDRFGAATVESADAIFPTDIVAYLPDSGAPIEAIDAARRDAVLGEALARGLSAYGRYVRARDRRSPDATLAGMLDVRLRAGEGPAPRDHAAIEALPPLVPTAGTYTIVEPPHWLWIEMRVIGRTSLRLGVGLVAFSDDGNILPLWPPGEPPTLATGSVVHVGFNQQEPLMLSRRADQPVSRWTLKVLAWTSLPGDPPLNLAGMAQASVQEEFAAVLDAARGQVRGSVMPAVAAPEQPAWCAWDLPVAVTRR